MDRITHALKIYANGQHKHARRGELLMHLVFDGETTMQMDLDIALKRPDVDCVDVIDCRSHTTQRIHANGRQPPRPSHRNRKTP